MARQAHVALGPRAAQTCDGIGGDGARLPEIPTQISQRVLPVADFARLLSVLREEGYRLVGPTVRDGAIVLDDISGIDDLPAGWTEDQDAGTYRLRRREDAALFGYSLGPHSWKQIFFVPKLRLWKATRNEAGFTVDAEPEPEAPRRVAILGARSCDLHAINIQDRVFRDGSFVDPDYAARRQDVFVLAVNCGQAGGTCFCVSMNTGPRVTQWFDLALTELLEGEHRFLVEVGTERGAEILARVGGEPAPPDDVRIADEIVERTASSMGRTMNTDGIRDLLARNLEHPRWDDIAQRCLACSNCTLVCPTCFCSTVEDVSDLRGETAERWRRWDSCFSLDHSHVHGGSVRASTRARYRQWLTHKLGTWLDQFGTSGCVGCGRCVTWCPVGIDITQELAAIRADDGAREPSGHDV